MWYFHHVDERVRKKYAKSFWAYEFICYDLCCFCRKMWKCLSFDAIKIGYLMILLKEMRLSGGWEKCFLATKCSIDINKPLRISQIKSIWGSCRNNEMNSIHIFSFQKNPRWFLAIIQKRFDKKSISLSNMLENFLILKLQYTVWQFSSDWINVFGIDAVVVVQIHVKHSKYF